MADTTLSAGTPACNTHMPASHGGDSNRDAQILQAFERWKALHGERGALPDTVTYEEASSPQSIEEKALWNLIDRTETQVHDLPAGTPAGIACKLWISIPHISGDAEPEAAAFRTDLDWFVAQDDALDWDLRCIVSALVALKTI